MSELKLYIIIIDVHALFIHTNETTYETRISDWLKTTLFLNKPDSDSQINV